MKKFSRFVISARRSDYESVKNSMSSLTWVVNHWRVKNGVEKLSWRKFGNHQSVKNVNGLTCLSRKSLKSEKCSRRNDLCEKFIIIGMWKKVNVLAGSIHNLWRAKNALEKNDLCEKLNLRGRSGKVNPASGRIRGATNRRTGN